MTPLIISGAGDQSSDGYISAQRFAKTLKKDEDVEIDEKTKQINLTDSGITKAERFFKVNSLSDIENIELNHYINNALKANFIMNRDDNYIVKQLKPRKACKLKMKIRLLQQSLSKTFSVFTKSFQA